MNSDNFKPSFQKHLEEGTINLWLEQGGNPHSYDSFSSALTMAVNEVWTNPNLGLKAVRELLTAGAQWTYPGMKGNALERAVEEGMVEVTQVLLEFASQQKTEASSFYPNALKSAIKGSSSFQHLKNTGMSEHIQHLFQRRAECVKLLYPLIQEQTILYPPKSLLRMLIEEAKSGMSLSYSENYLSYFLPVLKVFSKDIDESEKVDILDISLNHSRYPVTPKELRALFEFDISLNSTHGTSVVFLYVMNELYNPSEQLGYLVENMALLEEHGFSWTGQGKTKANMEDILAQFENEHTSSARLNWIRSRYETHLLTQQLPQTHLEQETKLKIRL